MHFLILLDQGSGIWVAPQALDGIENSPAESW
jgi:hypothetical protein